MIFLGLTKGIYLNTSEVAIDIVRFSVGAPLLGLTIGFILSTWMKRIIRDSTLIIAIMFAGSYLCFFIAEFTWVHVPGVLSIVTLGLYLSAVGKRRVYP